MSDAGEGRAVVLATRSLDKLRELRPLFGAAGIDVMDLEAAGMPEDPAVEAALEHFTTFEENALAKARYFLRRSGGGRAVVADDSGLEVFALGGEPGVRSKRWSNRPDLSGPALDEANNTKLLAELETRASGPPLGGGGRGGGEDRRARYVCVAAYVDASRECVFRGECVGRILHSPRGAGGFGYDPLFELDGQGVTFAELDREAKALVSHRGKAFALLLTAMRKWS